VAERKRLHDALLDKGRFVSELSGGTKALVAPNCLSSVAERRVAWMVDMLRSDPLATGKLQQRLADARAATAAARRSHADMVEQNRSAAALAVRQPTIMAAAAAARWAVEHRRVEDAAARRDEERTEWLSYAAEMQAHNTELAQARALRERQMTWLYVVALARVCTKLGRALEVERMIRERAARAALAAIVIQARYRGRVSRRWVANLRCTRHVLAQFVWRWRLRRAVIRKRRSVALITAFVNDFVAPSDASATTAALRRYIRHFRHCVIRAQRYVRSFLECLHARQEALRRLWHRVRGVKIRELADAGHKGGGSGGSVTSVSSDAKSSARVPTLTLPAPGAGGGGGTTRTARTPVTAHTGTGSGTARPPPLAAAGGAGKSARGAAAPGTTRRAAGGGGGGGGGRGGIRTEASRRGSAEASHAGGPPSMLHATREQRNDILHTYLRMRREEHSARVRVWVRVVSRQLMNVVIEGCVQFIVFVVGGCNDARITLFIPPPPSPTSAAKDPAARRWRVARRGHRQCPGHRVAPPRRCRQRRRRRQRGRQVAPCWQAWARGRPRRRRRIRLRRRR